MKSITQKLLAAGIFIAGYGLLFEKPLHAYSCWTEWELCNNENGKFCEPTKPSIFGGWQFTCCDKTTGEPSWGGFCDS